MRSEILKKNVVFPRKPSLIVFVLTTLLYDIILLLFGGEQDENQEDETMKQIHTKSLVYC